MSETTTWYEINKYDLPMIMTIKVISRTPHTITVQNEGYGRTDQRRQRITADMFENLEEAKAEVMKRLSARLETAKNNLVKAQNQLRKFEDSLNENPA